MYVYISTPLCQFIYTHKYMYVNVCICIDTTLSKWLTRVTLDQVWTGIFIGLFDGYIGLFCGCTGIFCGYIVPHSRDSQLSLGSIFTNIHICIRCIYVYIYNEFPRICYTHGLLRNFSYNQFWDFTVDNDFWEFTIYNGFGKFLLKRVFTGRQIGCGSFDEILKSQVFRHGIQ